MDSLTHHQEEDLFNADQLLQKAGVTVGMTVADLGVGRIGNVTLAAARLVTETGTVYAVDIVKDVLRIIEEKVQSAGLHNVIPIWTDLEVFGAANRIVDGSLDVGILCTTLFQSEKKAEMMKETVRMIKEGGTLLVVDWKTQNTSIGPPPDKRVNPQEIKQIAQTLGLTVIEEFEAGEYHWGLLLRK